VALMPRNAERGEILVSADDLGSSLRMRSDVEPALRFETPIAFESCW